MEVIAQVENIRPHRFRHEFGTSITRKGVDPLYSKELMGIKSDRVYGRYTQRALKQAAAKAYLQAIGEGEEQPFALGASIALTPASP